MMIYLLLALHVAGDFLTQPFNSPTCTCLGKLALRTWWYTAIMSLGMTISYSCTNEQISGFMFLTAIAHYSIKVCMTRSMAYAASVQSSYLFCLVWGAGHSLHIAILNAAATWIMCQK